MAKTNLVIIGLILISVSIGCKSLIPATNKTTEKPDVDFTKAGKSLDVRVQLDKKHSASGKVSPNGGSVSLTAADGTKFTLDVPGNALERETEITMTVVKSLDGSPLGTAAPLAVQLEPSGLKFNQAATLTISPSKEIPIKDQIVFGYESDGKDYHLAPVDPKSKEIKVQLLGFSGAGVGTGSDSAWAAHLAIEASSAKTRLLQKIAEATQAERRVADEGGTPRSSKEVLKPFLDAFKDQVVIKEMAAAELDCKHAQAALDDLILLERWLQLLGFADSATGSPGYRENVNKLKTIGQKCAAPYQIVGGLDDWQTNTKVCDIMKPFTLTGIVTMRFSGGLSGTYEYSGGPFNANGKGTYTISLPDGPGKPGTMTGSGSGEITGDKVYAGSGVEKYTLTPIEPCQ